MANQPDASRRKEEVGWAGTVKMLAETMERDFASTYLLPRHQAFAPLYVVVGTTGCQKAGAPPIRLRLTSAPPYAI